MHFAIRALRATAPRRSCLPIATLLNGIGYVEIARWNPPYASDQAAVVLRQRRRSRAHPETRPTRARPRSLSLPHADRRDALLVAPLVPHVGEKINGARLWIPVGPFSFQPVEFAKILLVFFFASYFAANRDLLSTPTQRLGGRNCRSPQGAGARSSRRGGSRSRSSAPRTTWASRCSSSRCSSHCSG